MKTMKKYSFLLLVMLATAISQSCTENIDTSDRYTYTQETLAQYLERHEDYTEYCKLLNIVNVSRRSESKVMQLLSARGHYSVFAPTNEAVQAYLDTLYNKGLINAPTWDGFRSEEQLDSIREVIVYNSVIDAGDASDAPIFYTSNFPEHKGTFTVNNMNDRQLILNIDEQSNFYINGTVELDVEGKDSIVGGALIDAKNRDIPAINGVMHQVHSVVAPSNETVTDKLTAFIEEGKGNIAIAKVMLLCGFGQELRQVRDEDYEDKMLTNQLDKIISSVNDEAPIDLPEHRKFGYTIFAEKDEFWAEQLGVDIKTVESEDLAVKMKNWVIQNNFYPDALDNEDWEDKNNVLNQFLSYHILPYRLTADRLVIHWNEKGYNRNNKVLTIPVEEFYTTIGEPRLMKIYQSADTDDKGIYINRFPKLDNARHGTYRETSCDDDKQGFRILTGEAMDVLNGYIYPIEAANPGAGPAALVYDESTRVNLQKQRIRFDVTTISPEIINNDLRLKESAGNNGYWGFTPDKTFKYLENIIIEDGTNFCYLPGVSYDWYNYQGDEFNVTGNYEMTFKLPPVPVRGTYEIRYAVQNNSQLRGMCQVYFGTNPYNLPAMGIPLDLRIGGTDSRLGWEEDLSSDDDYNAEVDKKMRNYGFMKGPEYYTIGGKQARAQNTTTRRIIVREVMDPKKTYYLKFKSVLADNTKEFFMDYLEFCAKEVYDNPAEPEDIW